MAKQKTAVILCNLGAPGSNARAAFRQYLEPLLLDQQLTHKPGLIRSLLLKLWRLPRLTKKTLQANNALPPEPDSAYSRISQRQQQALQRKLGNAIKVELMLRYSNPGFAVVIDQLLGSGYEKLIILPLLPQHSVLTTSCSELIISIGEKSPAAAVINFISDYHGEPDYIHALASSVQQHWRQQQRQRFLLISFAGLPGQADDAAGPYYEQCLGTANLLATILGLSYSQWALGFFSFHGQPTPLEPASVHTLAALADQGLKEVDVICPGCASDCLETRVQVQVADRASFLAHGGEQYHYIACLNERDDHIEMMAELVRPYLADDESASAS